MTGGAVAHRPADRKNYYYYYYYYSQHYLRVLHLKLDWT
jgi:hypothetical protein